MKRDATSMIGKQFHRLTVSAVDGVNPYGQTLWLCSCACGGAITVRKAHLVGGRVKSCGCYRREDSAARGRANRTHGLTDIPEYAVWTGMRYRCNTPTHPDWKYWGGAGVTICERWARFEDFLADMGRRPSPKHSIDRYPDPFGNYEPGNCRWATHTEQMNNRRDNFYKATVSTSTPT